MALSVVMVVCCVLSVSGDALVGGGWGGEGFLACRSWLSGLGAWVALPFAELG